MPGRARGWRGELHPKRRGERFNEHFGSLTTAQGFALAASGALGALASRNGERRRRVVEIAKMPPQT